MLCMVYAPFTITSWCAVATPCCRARAPRRAATGYVGPRPPQLAGGGLMRAVLRRLRTRARALCMARASAFLTASTCRETCGRSERVVANWTSREATRAREPQASASCSLTSRHTSAVATTRHALDRVWRTARQAPLWPEFVWRAVDSARSVTFRQLGLVREAGRDLACEIEAPPPTCIAR